MKKLVAGNKFFESMGFVVGDRLRFVADSNNGDHNWWNFTVGKEYPLHNSLRFGNIVIVDDDGCETDILWGDDEDSVLNFEVV